jgi:hypothetical protein
MSINKWTFKAETHALLDTGDYESSIKFIGDKDIIQTCGDELDDDDCQKFCDLLNLMPDLWSHCRENSEFMLYMNEKERIILKNLLIKLKEESMVSIVGEQWIDECFAQLSL